MDLSRAGELEPGDDVETSEEKTGSSLHRRRRGDEGFLSILMNLNNTKTIRKLNQ